MNPNNLKLEFGNILTNWNECLTTDKCHLYGSVSGCDSGCPVLLSGKCRNIGEVFEHTDLSDLSEEEFNELQKLYK